MDRINAIIERITETYASPIRVGSRCEANIFYRVEYLSPEELDIIAEYIAERVDNVCSPNTPEVLISLPGSSGGVAKVLARILSTSGEPLEVVSAEQLTASGPGSSSIGGSSMSAGGRSSWLRGMNAVIVNDVITTARSCLEVHTRATVLGATVLCWAAIIDRTFGPGPVPVVASFTGEPVRLLDLA